MRFEWPEALWLLLPAVWWLWRRHRQPAPALEFSSLDLVAPEAASWRTRWAWLPDAFRALAVLSLIAALARPQREVEEHLRVREGIAINLLMDISSSMDMPIPSLSGNKLTRMEAVKSVLQQFILGDGKELSGRPDDLLGLVTFARYADTISPLTTAHDALAEIISEIKIEDRPNEDGTAYGDAVTLAAARLHSIETGLNPTGSGEKIKNRVIVLLTDGENNCGRHLPLEATALAKQWGIRVYVISLADSDLTAGARPGDTAPSQAAQILMRMASETGGLYQSARDAQGLHAIYQKIDALEKSRIRIQTNTGWREWFPALTVLALVLIAAEMTLRSTLLRRIP